MKEKRYTISEASKLLDVENHVLRYWEEELDLTIPRNELGHRYYREEEVQLLKCIKELKNKGFQLKAVKEVLPELDDGESTLEETTGNVVPIQREKMTVVQSDSSANVVAKSREEKLQEFENIMTKIIGRALRENAGNLGQTVGEHITDKMLEEVDELLEERDLKEEERYRKLDEAIRSHQKARQEIAATLDKRPKKPSLFLRKINVVFR